MALSLATKYLASLPRGLDGYPTCEVHTNVFEPHVRDFGRIASDPGLPAPVADLLLGRLGSRVWVPETVFQTAFLAVRDLGFSDDRAFHEWTYRTNRDLFDKPLVRSLMKLVSPSLITLGASRRWAAFHRGSDISAGSTRVSEGRSETTLTLRFPENLFAKMFLDGLSWAFAAALDSARAREPRVVLASSTTTSAEYVASWR